MSFFCIYVWRVGIWWCVVRKSNLSYTHCLSTRYFKHWESKLYSEIVWYHHYLHMNHFQPNPNWQNRLFVSLVQIYHPFCMSGFNISKKLHTRLNPDIWIVNLIFLLLVICVVNNEQIYIVYFLQILLSCKHKKQLTYDIIFQFI